jgi:hypothetical protein
MGPAGDEPSEAERRGDAGWVAAALAALCFAAGIAVIVLLVWWF